MSHPDAGERYVALALRLRTLAPDLVDYAGPEADVGPPPGGLAALAGDSPGYRELFRRCHGAEPVVRPDADFEAAHGRLAEVLPGRGPVRERYGAGRERRRVAPEQVGPALRALLDGMQARTGEAFGLPDGESVELELVADQNWMAYAEPRDALTIRRGWPSGRAFAERTPDGFRRLLSERVTTADFEIG